MFLLRHFLPPQGGAVADFFNVFSSMISRYVKSGSEFEEFITYVRL